MKDEYNCSRCGDEWGFIPEDYDREEDHPTTCPFCNMPKTQLFHDVYKEEGFFAAAKEVLRRL